MTNWVYIGKLSDIPKRGARKVKALGCNVAIFRTGDDAVFALEDSCPHKQGPLSDGIVHGKGVACPLHNWVIDFETGEARAPDVGCVKRFAIELRGEEIYLGGALAAASEGTLAGAEV